MPSRMIKYKGKSYYRSKGGHGRKAVPSRPKKGQHNFDALSSHFPPHYELGMHYSERRELTLLCGKSRPVLGRTPQKLAGIQNFQRE